MKKNKLLAISAGIILLAGIVSAASSLAWFFPTTQVGNEGETNAMPIDGSSSSGYFAYGDGSVSRPFGIRTPRHLYNLAWLQYLGMIHLNDTQLKFELADNIDMSGWTLPPIGTETYPFIGDFNGQGFVVSNLTISNNFSEYNVHPSLVNSTNFVQPHILGFFGVVGNYNSLPAASYSSAANQFTNTALYNVTVKTATVNSLMGIAAGYVDSNVKNIVVDNSSIDIASTLSNTTSYTPDGASQPFTQNISDFSLVGYTTKKKSIRKASQKTYGLNIDTNISFNATEDGNDNGWGGSIDMKSVLERLQRIRSNYSTNQQFAYKRTYGIHEGVKDTNYTPTNTSRNSDRTYPTYSYANDTAHKEWGHFHFMADQESDRTYYALMGGGHLEIDNYFEYNEHNGYKITDGTNYLNLNRNSTSFENGTNAQNATIWNFTYGTSAIYYRYANTTNTTTTYTSYYLYNNNGKLEVTTSNYSQTNWTITDIGDGHITITNGDYYLIYDNGWRLYNNAVGNNYYVISDGTHYMDEATQYHALSTTSQGDAAQFIYDTTNNRYVLRDNTSYNLGRYDSDYPVQIWDDNSTWYRLVDGSGNLISSHQGEGYLREFNNRGQGQNRYVAWSGSNMTKPWVTVNNINQATLMHVTLIEEDPPVLYLSGSAYQTSSGPDEYFDKQKSFMNYQDNDVTYFPLSTVDNTSNFDPAENNTAYVVAGSSITSSTNSYSASLSNVRFASYYAIQDNISNDYNSTTGEFTHIYTINDSLQKEEITNNIDDYNRLKDSSSALGTIMKGQTQTYGLHFMESTISMDAITTASYVKMNNVVHTNYELPVNSIDFNLKEFGYINFLAGSYFNRTTAPVSRNDSFFALYQIERLDSAPNKINRILEIKGVYQHSSKTKNYSYVYELTDGTNTFFTKPYKVTSSEGGREWLYDTEHDYATNQYVDSLPSNYNKVFDTKRIKKNNLSASDFNYHVYYFEIPMNDGEYCLGSVSGGVGSYLMYLDIGANAAKTQRTIFYEKFSFSEKTFYYPDGVSLGTLPTTYSSGVAAINIASTIDPTDSVCVVIKTSAVGTFTIDRNGSDVALTRAQAANAPPVYSGDAITLIHETNSSTSIDVVPATNITKDVKRMQYYDYMINTDTLVVTTFIDTSTDGGSTYTRQVIQTKYSGQLVDPNKVVSSYSSDNNQVDNMKIYRSDTGVRYTSAEVISQTSLPISSNKLSGTIVLELTLLLDDVNSYTTEISLIAIVDTSSETDTYYVFNGYTIVITPTSGKIYVKVVGYTANISITVVDVGNDNSSSTSTVTNSQTVNGTAITGLNQEIVIEYQAPSAPDPEP